MTQKLNTDDLIGRGDVDESRHRQWTERQKVLTAQLIIGSGFLAAIAALLLPFEHLKDLHQNAWTLITVIVSSGLGFLYAARDRQ